MILKDMRNFSYYYSAGEDPCKDNPVPVNLTDKHSRTFLFIINYKRKS
jgi:hypothetical protein